MAVRRQSPAWAWILAAAWLAFGPRAAAIIRVEIPVSKIYKVSTDVLVGRVERVHPANRVVDAQLTETLKGAAAGARFRVQIVNPAGLVKSVAAGAPVVVFAGRAAGRSVAVVHLADTWLLAERIAGADPPAWRVGQVHDIKQSFPGRTAALVKVVRALRDGKDLLRDKAQEDVFRGGVRALGKLPVAKPRFLSAADLSGDRKCDLLVAAAAGVRLFLATPEGFDDATARWGLAGAAGDCRALGDVNADGRIDLLIGTALWINTGSKLAACPAEMSLPAKARVIAAALLDATGDRRPDAVFALADGRAVTFENPGAADKPWPRRPIRYLWRKGPAPLAAALGRWGDNGRGCLMVVRADGATRYGLAAEAGPPADHERLTGRPLAAHRAFAAGLRNVLAVPIDINADRRGDLLVLADAGGLLLVNRGLGTYLVNPDVAAALTGPGRLPFKLDATACCTAADLHRDGFEDLLVLTADGRLYEVSNTPFRAEDD